MALAQISLFESNGNGITSETFHTHEQNFRFSTAIAMLFFDCFLVRTCSHFNVAFPFVLISFFLVFHALFLPVFVCV
jgi:hypothetical protein